MFRRFILFVMVVVITAIQVAGADPESGLHQGALQSLQNIVENDRISTGFSASEWEGGLDLTVEGSKGLSGGNSRGQALQCMALGHAEWNNADTGGHRPALGGYGSVLIHAGHGPTERFLGDFLSASNMEAYSSARLYSWWLRVRHHGWDFRAGALLADEEFAGTAGGGHFLNSSFGWPAFISANVINTGPAFFVPALGARLERRWNDTDAWRFGIYDGDSFDSPEGDARLNRHGIRFETGADQGLFLMSEIDWANGTSAWRYKLGVWMHTAKFNDVRDDAAGGPVALTGAAPQVHGSNYGGYVAVEREWGGGLGIFVRGGVAPADRNILGWAFDAGLSWAGVIPGRPSDVAFLGVAHVKFSLPYAESAHAADPGASLWDFEQVIEAGYTVALGERWTLQPDVQYIRHPGRSSALRDALVCFLRAKFSY